MGDLTRGLIYLGQWHKGLLMCLKIVKHKPFFNHSLISWNLSWVETITKMGFIIHKALENKLKHMSCHGNLGYESNIGFIFLLTKK